MKLIKLSITMLVINLTACNYDSSETEIREIFIDHYKSECYGLALSLCMRSRLASENEWSFFYGNIEGFNYEWGYVHKLRVRISIIANPPEDGTSKKYTLLEILSKENESSATTFDIATSRAPGLIINTSTGIYELYGEKEFTCTPLECETLESLITQNMAILFEFSHNATPGDPMRLIQFKCSASMESFNDSCL